MLESLMNDNSNIKEIEVYLNQLSLKDLFKLYLKCNTTLYFQNYTNISKILDIICTKIMNSLNSEPLMQIVDFYARVFDDQLLIEDHIESNNNIINVRRENLKDNFFLEYESEKNHLTKLEFVEQYSKIISYYENDLHYLRERFKCLDKLQNSLYAYIDNRVINLSSKEKQSLLLSVRTKIEANSKEILKRDEMIKDKKKFDVEMRMNFSSDIFDLLNVTNLKNYNYILMDLEAKLAKKKKEK